MSNDDRMKITDFFEQHNVMTRIVEDAGIQLPKGFDPMAKAYSVTFKIPSERTVSGKKRFRTLSVPYFTGSAIKEVPKAEEVFDCILSDARIGEEHMGDIDSFCQEFGYEPDPETGRPTDDVKRTLRACEKMSARVEAWLPDGVTKWDFVGIDEEA